MKVWKHGLASFFPSSSCNQSMCQWMRQTKDYIPFSFLNECWEHSQLNSKTFEVQIPIKLLCQIIPNSRSFCTIDHQILDRSQVAQGNRIKPLHYL